MDNLPYHCNTVFKCLAYPHQHSFIGFTVLDGFDTVQSHSYCRIISMQVSYGLLFTNQIQDLGLFHVKIWPFFCWSTWQFLTGFCHWHDTSQVLQLFEPLWQSFLLFCFLDFVRYQFCNVFWIWELHICDWFWSPIINITFNFTNYWKTCTQWRLNCSQAFCKCSGNNLIVSVMHLCLVKALRPF